MNKDKIEAVATLSAMLMGRVWPQVNHATAARDAMALSKIARRAESVAAQLCNGVIEQDIFERRAKRIRRDADAVALKYGMVSQIGGDPRGYSLRMFASPGAAELRGNTWGGDESGYGI